MQRNRFEATGPEEGNPFFSEKDPAETLDRCASVIAFINDAVPAMQIVGWPLNAASADGFSSILSGVEHALQRERKRVEQHGSKSHQ